WPRCGRRSSATGLTCGRCDMGDPTRPAGDGEPAAPRDRRDPGAAAAGWVDPDANVVLIGFMGAGKSEVGRRLARRLNRPFLDADLIIEARAGRSVPDIFRAEGERGFRRREAEVIA